MNVGDLLNSQLFWALVFTMSAFLVAGYFLLRQAIVDSHFEIKRREELERQRKQGQGQGGIKK